MLTVIGEALIDVIERPGLATQTHVGGSPLNVAVGLARLGHPVQWVGRYGQDAFGRLVASHLMENSVLNPTLPDAAPTGTATAILDTSGAARYSFALEWALPWLRERLDACLQGATLLHTGSLAAMLRPGADAVLAAVEHAHPLTTVSYDPNCRPSITTDASFARAQAEKFVRLADVVKASDEDLQWLYPGRSVEESAQTWLELGPAVVVITRGADGPWGAVEAGTVAVAAPRVSVVDTVGAGDSFMSALLGAMVDRELDGAARRARLRALSTAELGTMMSTAAAAAAITVSRAGANPPSKQELMHSR